MSILYIVMPAYNEADNIRDVVTSWYPVLDGKDEHSRFIIADSGSTDGTHEILLELAKQYHKLHILSNTGKYHGEKLIALYDHAISCGADYIFQTDSDGQTKPDEFGAFWEMRENYAGIFGYRQTREDGYIRVFVEHVVCFLLKVYFRVQIPDANAPFRLMKADALKNYLYRLPSDYNLPNIMIATYFAYYNEKITFKNVTFRPRQGGKNSINLPKIIKIGWNALWDFYRLKKEMNNEN